MPGWKRGCAPLRWAAVLVALSAVAIVPGFAGPHASSREAPTGPPAPAQPPASGAGTTAPAAKEDEDVRLGRRAAAELEREYKLVRNPQQVARVERIGRDIAAASDEPSYRHVFRILDTDDVNAISLPGGFTYVTRGMLAYVHSDHELAGVLAHEIAHAARHHVRDLLRRESRANQRMLAGLLGAILLGGGRSEGLGNLLFGAEVLKTASLSGHTQKAESEADRVGVDYLIKCGKYNPVGALTVIERLARDEARRTGPPLGILQDHPPSAERAAALEEYIRSQGLPVSRLAVDDHLRAMARSAEGGKAADVVLDGVTFFRTAAGIAAAEAIASHLNRLLERDLQMRDVRVGLDGVSVVAGGETLFVVAPTDAALQSRTREQVAQTAARDLVRALWKAYMEQVL